MTISKTGPQGFIPQQQVTNQPQTGGTTPTTEGPKTETGKTQKTQSTSEVQTTFTSVPQETVKKESGPSTMDHVSQQVSQSGVERLDPGQRKSVSLGRSTSKSTIGEGQTQVGTTPPLTIPTSGTMDAKPVFDSLKADYPHLGAHIDNMLKMKVGIDVIQTNKGTSAYSDQPSNSIKVQNDGTLDTPKLKDNVLYESFNAWATGEYKNLDKALSSRTLSIPEYGGQKARAEAQVTIKYVDSILEGFKGTDKVGDRAKLVGLAQQVPVDLEAPGARQVQDRLNVDAQKLGLTEKGLRAMGWAERLSPGYLQNPQPSEHKKLEDDFLAQPHQANPEKPRFGLSSKDLYSYEGIERQKATGLIGMLQAPLKGDNSDAASQVRNTIQGLRPNLEQLDAMPEGTVSEKDAKANAKCALYQNTLQGIIRDFPTMQPKVQPHLLSQGIKTFAGIT